MSQPIDIPNKQNATQAPQSGSSLSPEERRLKTDKLMIRLDSLRSKMKNNEHIDVRKDV